MELIYSVGGVFDNVSPNGCLSQYNTEKYHIPAYQRGYKWASTPNGAVSILLSDLWDAFYKTPEKEYYLQYITVKKITSEKYLELIDGQQRITTLSIVLSVYSYLLNEENIAKYKLDYAVRSSFFNENIFCVDNLKELLGSKGWEQFVGLNEEEFNKQDIFHFYEAAKKVNSFVKSIDKSERVAFYHFILDKVKVIVNAVEAHIDSETVFKNLNSNKIPLTEVELIKGLFITRVGRSADYVSSRSFIEITEMRGKVGQLWDEITNWANTSEVASFYFNGKSGMHEFLTLIALSSGYNFSNDKTDFPVFNFFLNQPNQVKLFESIKHIYRTLSDWFGDHEKYNLIGFTRLAKNSTSNNLLNLKLLLNEESNSSLIRTLKSLAKELVKGELKELRYGESDGKIHAILLYLNIFFKNPGEQNYFRFDFHSYIKGKWTLEHIFPQSPEGKGAVLSEQNKVEILEILGGKESLDSEIVEVLEKQERSDEEKNKYYKYLQSSNYLNSIGNMCLLTSSDNSSNGCMFFKDKRSNILKRIQKGSFVPKHTFDVFSKMISEEMSQNSIDTWSKNDIDVHFNWIEKNLKEIEL